MPVSKSVLTDRIQEGKEQIASGEIPSTTVGTLLVYSFHDWDGPFSIGLVHEVDDGYVLAVRHLDGTVRDVARGADAIDARRWFISSSVLTKPPEEVLALIGDIEVDDLDVLREAIRPYTTYPPKNAKDSAPVADGVSEETQNA